MRAHDPFRMRRLAVSTTHVVLALLLGGGDARAQATAIDAARVASALRELREACALDAGALWGRTLCGPTLVVQPDTRAVLASQSDAGGVLTRRDDGLYAGTLPTSVSLANTAATWSGTTWAMVLDPLPTDRYARLTLLLHESFHREQSALGLTGRDATAAHLDERDGRYWLRLELRAYARALTARDARAAEFLRDALRFRAARRSAVAGADTVEDALERHEGLAEYTGTVLALRATGETPSRVAAALARFEAQPSYVRSFAYATGPALGLLLDRYAPGWRTRAAGTTSLSGALAAAVAMDLRDGRRLRREALARAAVHGGPEVARDEDARVSARTARLARLRARLVDGPVLVLRQQGLQLSFDPGGLVPLGAAGTVYASGSFRAPWGELRVAGGDGVLLDAAFTRGALAAPSDTGARPLRGDGWVLELAPGWRVRPAAGERAGDLTLAPPD
jgi:hypothetical protein